MIDHYASSIVRLRVAYCFPVWSTPQVLAHCRPRAVWSTGLTFRKNRFGKRVGTRERKHSFSRLPWGIPGDGLLWFPTPSYQRLKCGADNVFGHQFRGLTLRVATLRACSRHPKLSELRRVGSRLNWRNIAFSLIDHQKRANRWRKVALTPVYANSHSRCEENRRGKSEVHAG